MSETTNSLFGIHASALVLREQRLKLIAGNLANADTPNYHAQDIDFKAALSAASEADSGLRVTDSRHIGAIAGDVARIERPTQQPSLDGNTVDTDIEHAAFARAALEYRASLTFLESRVRGLLTAITGQ